MKDKNKITKYKCFFSFEKELAYINKMNREGWKLVYIKGGVIYSFEKCEPDEYFTVLHATAREKVLEISSFAAQCGYQTIPHPMDSFGDFLYLTGKKSEVSSDFVYETSEKIDSAKRIYHSFQTLSIIFIAISICLVPLNISYTGMIISIERASSVSISYGVFNIVFAAAEIAICIWAIVLTVKAHRYLKQLQKESKIYE